MFDRVEARYALRCVLFGISGFLISLQAADPIDWGAAMNAGITGAIAALAYAGIGAAVPAVEPNIANKLGPDS